MFAGLAHEYAAGHAGCQIVISQLQYRYRVSPKGVTVLAGPAHEYAAGHAGCQMGMNAYVGVLGSGSWGWGLRQASSVISTLPFSKRKL